MTAHGLTTAPIPYGERAFQIDFDFIDHALRIETSDGPRWQMLLHAQAVADFHAAIMAALSDVRIEVHIDEIPNEVPDPIRSSEDRVHATYNAEYAQRFGRVLLQADRMFKAFRTSFIGKCRTVHFFWGSFDLAVTRFSGRRAPRHPGGVPHLSDEVACEAYSHEVSSAGFWPGGGAIDYRPSIPTLSQPEGFRSAPVRPEAAFFSQELGEFVLPYDAVRTAASPDTVLLGFLQNTYEAAADAGKWNRAALECAPGIPGVPRANFIADKRVDGRSPTGQRSSGSAHCVGRILRPRGKISVLIAGLRKASNQAANDQFRAGPLR